MKETMIFGLTEVARSNLLNSAFRLKSRSLRASFLSVSSLLPSIV